MSNTTLLGRPIMHRGLQLDRNERSEGAPTWARHLLSEMDDEILWSYRERGPLEAKLAVRFGLDPSQVLATNGGDEGIAYLFASHGEGGRLILPRPCYGFYREQARAHRLAVTEIAPAADLELDVDAIEEVVAKTEDALLIICRPNNPTGELIAYDRMLRLLELCRGRGTTLFLDEAYAELAEEDMVSALSVFPNLVILRTFSKAFGLAGLRVGCLLGPSEKIAALRGRALPYNIAAPSLVMAERALEEDARAEMRAYAEAVARQRDRLAGYLRKIGVAVNHSHANFLLLRLGRSRADLLQAGLSLHGLEVRRFTEPELSGCVRISIPSEAQHLHEVIDRVLSPELICLDVDGCLIDTRDSFDAVVAATVDHFSGQAIDTAEIYALRARGGFNDDNHISRELIRVRGIDVPLSEVQIVFRNFYLGTSETPGLYRREKVLIDLDFLRRLCARYHVALVTGRNREEIVPALELLELPSDQACWTIDDVRRGKPDPEGILAAAERFGTRRVWMVGDNPDDIRAARAAGALPIGVAMGNVPALEQAGAVRVLDHINELEEML